MEGLSAGCTCVAGAAGCCADAAGAAWAHSEADKTQRHTGKSACATPVRDNLIRNNLKNNCIVQLRILLRQRCGHFNFQTVHYGCSHPCLARKQLWDGLQRDPVEPERVTRDRVR